MTDVNVFDWLVKTHCQNLQRSLPYIKDGVLRHSKDDYESIKEGFETNAYKGILLLRNSDTLLTRLVEDGLVNPYAIRKSVTINSQEEFLDFYDKRGDEDGVWVYESGKNQIFNIRHVKDPNKDHLFLSKKLPQDFIQYSGCQEDNLEIHLQKDIGTKTRLALEITERYPDVHAGQIKRSAYGNLRMGKVTGIDSYGLNQEFFFLQENGAIYGIFRKYNEKTELMEEWKIPASSLLNNEPAQERTTKSSYQESFLSQLNPEISYG